MRLTPERPDAPDAPDLLNTLDPYAHLLSRARAAMLSSLVHLFGEDAVGTAISDSD